MNILFCLICLVTSSVDTLWTVDFSTQPSGWVAGPYWEYLDDSIFLYLICGGGFPSGYHSLEDSIVSPDFVVPPSADSLVLVFDHYWWGVGNANAPTEWSQSTSTLEMYAPDVSPDPIELWEITGYCGSPPDDPGVVSNVLRMSYNVTDSGFISIPIADVSPGNTLTFVFRGLVEANVDYMAAWAVIYWNLYTFHILNYTDVSLERSTWGSIKTSF